MRHLFHIYIFIFHSLKVISYNIFSAFVLTRTYCMRPGIEFSTCGNVSVLKVLDFGVMEKAQSVKYLLHKHKDLSSDPQHSCQCWAPWPVSVISVLWRQKLLIYGLTALPAYSSWWASVSVTDLSQKLGGERYLMSTSDLQFTCTNKCTHSHGQSYICPAPPNNLCFGFWD